MKIMKPKMTISLMAAVSISAAGASIASSAVSDATVSVKAMADALHLVMDSDRSVYTKKMFRFGSELAMKRAEKLDDVNFSYTLQSLWPINKQNAPKTKAEKEGLKYVAENKGKNYYTTEELGGTTYFTAVYADTGVAPVCVSCHNKHPDTPKKDFKLGDVMGGVVIRIPIES